MPDPCVTDEFDLSAGPVTLRVAADWLHERGDEAGAECLRGAASRNVFPVKEWEYNFAWGWRRFAPEAWLPVWNLLPAWWHNRLAASPPATMVVISPSAADAWLALIAAYRAALEAGEVPPEVRALAVPVLNEAALSTRPCSTRWPRAWPGATS